MIFVTVGTSLPHDELIQMIDKLVGEGSIQDRVIAQRGAGRYIPRNIKHFRFAPNLDVYYSDADIVISNCGAGTIMENTTKGRRLIVIQNPNITGGHEWELVTKMEKADHLVWCRDVNDLLRCIEKARSMIFKQFKPDKLNLSMAIKQIIA